MLSHVCNWYVKPLWSQVQVYWSESPKAKFVKQGEVDQVNIILFYLWQWSGKHYSDQFLHDNDQNNCKIVLPTSSPTGFLHCKADS